MLQYVDTAIAFAVVMLLLSLVITALVQIANSLLDMRGRILQQGIKNLLLQVDPAMGDKVLRAWNDVLSPTIAKRIAKAVTLHPSIHHVMRRAKAIRPKELILILHDLASDKPNKYLDVSVKTTLQAYLAKRAPAESKTTDVEDLAAQLAAKFPNIDQAISNTAIRVAGTVRKVEADVNAWFGTVMERSSEVFAANSRVFTFIFAVLLATGLRIDSGEILRQVWTNPQIREKLNRMADETLSQADSMLNGSRDQRASKALKSLAAAYEKDSVLGPELSKAPANLAGCDSGSKWLTANSTVSAHKDIGKITGEFNAKCQEETLNAMGAAGAELRLIRVRLAATDLQILSPPIADKEEWFDWWRAGPWNGRSILGMLGTIILLSLGAPFWYKLLLRMANLKPAIARAISPNADDRKEDESKAASTT